MKNSNIFIQAIHVIDILVKIRSDTGPYYRTKSFFLLKVFAFALLVASAYARPQSFDNFEGITLEGDGNFDDATIQELAANDLYDVSTIYDIIS